MDVFGTLAWPLAVVVALFPAGAAAVAWDCRARNRWRSAVTFARIGMVAGFLMYGFGFAAGAAGARFVLPAGGGFYPAAVSLLAVLALGGGATVLCWWILQDARRDVPERRGP